MEPSSSTVLRSMPGAPLLRLTPSKTHLRFSFRRTSVIRVEICDDGVLWRFAWDRYERGG